MSATLRHVSAEPADHSDSGPDAYPGRDDPDDSKGDGRERNERAQLSSQAVARLAEALPLSRHLLANLIGAALSHFRAAS